MESTPLDSQWLAICRSTIVACRANRCSAAALDGAGASSFPLTRDVPGAHLFFAGMAQTGAEVRYTQRACRRLAKGSVEIETCAFPSNEPNALKQNEHVSRFAPCENA